MLTYRAATASALAVNRRRGSITDVRERVRTLFRAPDKAGRFLRDTLAPTLVYTAMVAPSIAHSPDDVDRVMRWGFGWELGPFELIDAIGVRTGARCGPRNESGPAVAELIGQKPETAPETAGNASAAHRRSAETRRAFAADRRAPCRRRQTSRSCAAQKSVPASSRRMRAPASWILATVCSASSSTRR